ncbi:hypothetical protein T12_9510 [Trichinella patagoniensis]|uniref:Uncharacterized protein n=1 Tax=Trichinella patagoniensis TaxID=990121 RepID=A0A0V1AFQ9_9BILA|nr:hypothetical protein T12_9510 [Trichinella patagoniensis]
MRQENFQFLRFFLYGGSSDFSFPSSPVRMQFVQKLRAKVQIGTRPVAAVATERRHFRNKLITVDSSGREIMSVCFILCGNKNGKTRVVGGEIFISDFIHRAKLNRNFQSISRTVYGEQPALSCQACPVARRDDLLTKRHPIRYNIPPLNL